MDALNMIITVPSWAYDFCFYYVAVAAVVTVFSLYTIVKTVMLPAPLLKEVGGLGIVLNIVLATVVSVLLTMMQFWICRGALKPVKESFAVTCSKNEDCTAVMGTQREGSPCTCGDRGFCGGCAMNNHMEGGEPEPAGI
jgi:hypothetical protein